MYRKVARLRKIILAFVVVPCVCALLILGHYQYVRQVSPGVAAVQSHDTGHIRVSIVEEHHEVLEHWFEAAEDGLIPKEGNTLIHIDAHSDLAPAIYVEGFPDFRWPTKSEIKFMLQENDNFIQVAATTRFIKRLIWVLPTWLDKVMRPYPQHHTPIHRDTDDGIMHLNQGKFYLHYGYFFGKTKEEGFGKQMCFCKESLTRSEKKCITMKKPQYAENEEEENVEPTLEIEHCKAVGTIHTETWNQNTALEKIQEPDWIGEDEKVLLDIDEDFWGVQSPYDSLKECGITYRRAERIGDFLTFLICPKNSIDESKGDKLVGDIIDVIRSTCRSSSPCYADKSKLHVIQQKAAKLLDYTLNYQKHILCKTGTFDGVEQPLEKIFQNTVKLLTLFNNVQLKKLKDVGFCLSHSLKIYNTTPEFQSCLGLNPPNSPVLVYHTPTKSEVKSSMDNIDDFINKLHTINTLQHVTIARSVRDGYTPRKYFNQIENSIKHIFRKLDPLTEFRYDSGLMGGHKGWGDRL